MSISGSTNETQVSNQVGELDALSSRLGELTDKLEALFTSILLKKVDTPQTKPGAEIAENYVTLAMQLLVANQKLREIVARLESILNRCAL